MLRPSPLPHALRAAVRAVPAILPAILPAIFLALGPVVVPLPAAGAAAPPDPSQPLLLRMRSITPDYVPDHGPILVQGTVTNASDRTWTAINVHGFMGATPMTTTQELAAAARTPVDVSVGDRITVPGTFDRIDSLAPGATAAFSIRLPHSALPVSGPGVYWFGVHALGDNGVVASRVAVGRDRTFLPFVPASLQTTGDIEDVALLGSVRSGVTRAADGTIEDTAAWLANLRSGRLHQAVALGRAAQSHPVTWIVDPAVIDAVRQLAAGNPPRTLSPPRGGGPSTSPGPSASSSAGPSSSGSGSAALSPTQRSARRWLPQMRQMLVNGTGQTLGLPYGDLAVDGALRHDPDLLDEGVRRTGRVLRPWHVPLSPVVAPPSSRMAATDVARLRRDTEVLLDDTGIVGPSATAVRVSGRTVVLAAAAAADGGPGPVDPTSNLALRQRVLAEAAVRFLDHQQPLVVRLPGDFRHPKPSFFTGLDVPWVRLTSLDGATAGMATPVAPARLRPPGPQTPQLGRRLYSVARATLDEGRILQSVLAGNHSLRRRLFTEVAGNASYAAAKDRFGAQARMDSTSRWVTAALDGIDLAAPESVTLASASGRFSAIVSNTLDVPVTVRVRALADPAMKITGGETIQLAPRGQTNVLLQASTRVPGVHTVTLELTNQAGQPLGASETFPVRAEQVSRLIWVIIGAGVALLFAAIVVRLTRRVLGRNRG